MNEEELKQFAILGSYNNLMLKAIMQRLFGVKEAQKICKDILEQIQEEYKKLEEEANENTK